MAIDLITAKIAVNMMKGEAEGSIAELNEKIEEARELVEELPDNLVTVNEQAEEEVVIPTMEDIEEIKNDLSEFINETSDSIIGSFYKLEAHSLHTGTINYDQWNVTIKAQTKVTFINSGDWVMVTVKYADGSTENLGNLRVGTEIAFSPEKNVVSIGLYVQAGSTHALIYVVSDFCKEIIEDVRNTKKLLGTIDKNVEFTTDSVAKGTTNYKVWDYNISANSNIRVYNLDNDFNLLATFADNTTAVIGTVKANTITEFSALKDIAYLGVYIPNTSDTHVNFFLLGNYGNEIGSKLKKVVNEFDATEKAKRYCTESVLPGTQNNKVWTVNYPANEQIELINVRDKINVIAVFGDESSEIITLDSNKVIKYTPAKSIVAFGVYVFADSSQETEFFVLGNLYAGMFEKTIETYNFVSPRKIKLMTLGDSITQQGIAENGWIRYFLEKVNADLVANTAVSGAWLPDNENTIYDGSPNASNQDSNVLGNQVQNIINNSYEAPDIIMIAIGTNSGINITKQNMIDTYYDSNGNLIPLVNVNRKTHAGAFRYAFDTLHRLYPDALIVWCTPIIGHHKIRPAEAIEQYAESLRIATEYVGIPCIDTIRCGINGINEGDHVEGEYLMDGLHPNARGAKKMGYYNAMKIKPYINTLIQE